MVACLGAAVLRARSRQRTVATRRAWAQRILMSHAGDDGGGCTGCLALHGIRVSWPCAAAQVASLYGQGHVLEPGQSGDRTTQREDA